MRIELCPLGVEWFDTNMGGVPTRHTTLVSGVPKSGKTSIALAFTYASLERGPVCFVTTDLPEALIEFSDLWLERDLRPHVRSKRLTILRFSQFLESKVRSLGSSERPLAELKSLIDERVINTLVFDTIDPMLGWLEAASAKPFVRGLMQQINALEVTCLCTARSDGRSGSVGVQELASHAAGALELTHDRKGQALRVRNASWCNVENLKVRFDFVQRKGIVARGDAFLDAPPDRPTYEGGSPSTTLVTYEGPSPLLAQKAQELDGAVTVALQAAVVPGVQPLAPSFPKGDPVAPVVVAGRQRTTTGSDVAIGPADPHVPILQPPDHDDEPTAIRGGSPEETPTVALPAAKVAKKAAQDEGDTERDLPRAPAYPKIPDPRPAIQQPTVLGVPAPPATAPPVLAPWPPSPAQPLEPPPQPTKTPPTTARGVPEGTTTPSGGKARPA